MFEAWEGMDGVVPHAERVPANVVRPHARPLARLLARLLMPDMSACVASPHTRRPYAAGTPEHTPATGIVVNDPLELVGLYALSIPMAIVVDTLITLVLPQWITTIARQASPDADQRNVYLLPNERLPIAVTSVFQYSVAVSVVLQAMLMVPLALHIGRAAVRAKRWIAWLTVVGALMLGLASVPAGRLWWVSVLALIASGTALTLASLVHLSLLNVYTGLPDLPRIMTTELSLTFLGVVASTVLFLGLVSVSPRTVAYLIVMAAGLWLVSGLWGTTLLRPHTVWPLGLSCRAVAADEGQSAGLSGQGQGAVFVDAVRMAVYAMPHTVRLLIASMLSLDGLRTAATAMVLLITDVFGYPQWVAGLVFLLSTLLAVPAAILAALAARHVRPTYVIAASLLSLVSVLVVVVVWTPPIWALLLMSAPIALGLGGAQTLFRVLFSASIPTSRSTIYFAVFTLADRGTSFVGPLLFGIINQTTGKFRLAFVVPAALMLLGAAIAQFHSPTKAVAAAIAEEERLHQPLLAHQGQPFQGEDADERGSSGCAVHLGDLDMDHPEQVGESGESGE